MLTIVVSPLVGMVGLFYVCFEGWACLVGCDECSCLLFWMLLCDFVLVGWLKLWLFVVTCGSCLIVGLLFGGGFCCEFGC